MNADSRVFRLEEYTTIVHDLKTSFNLNNTLLMRMEEADARRASNKKMQTCSFQYHFQFHVGMGAMTGSQDDFTEYKLVSIM
jgi:hypothetical protein